MKNKNKQDKTSLDSSLPRNMADLLTETAKMELSMPEIPKIDKADEQFDAIIETTPNIRTLSYDVLNRLRLGYNLGLTTKDVCMFAGIDRVNLYKIMNTNPVLKKYIELWSIAPKTLAMNVLYSLLKSKNDNVRLNAAKYILENANANASISNTQKTTNATQAPIEPEITTNLSKQDMIDLSDGIKVDII